MKRVYLIALFTLLFTTACFSQAINNISTRCPSPNRTVFSSVRAAADGDIDYTPCPSRSSIFTGLVDFSGATVTGVVSGSGTNNFIPRWVGASTLGDTPYSWDGSFYSWNNTALNGTFTMNVRPSAAGLGIFTTGSATNFLTLTESISTLSSLSTTIALKATNAAQYQALNTTIGDAQGVGNSTKILLNDGAGTIDGTAINGATFNTGNDFFKVGDTAAVGGGATATLNDTTSSFVVTNTAGQLSGISLFANIVDVGSVAAGNSTRLRVRDSGGTPKSFTFATTANDAVIITTGVQLYNTQRTLTAGGTTGAQTINKPFGSVNFAAAATAITVTNSTVTATSFIWAMAQTNDATCAVKNVVPAAGTFVINMTAACTAETRVAFQVNN